MSCDFEQVFAYVLFYILSIVELQILHACRDKDQMQHVTLLHVNHRGMVSEPL